MTRRLSTSQAVRQVDRPIFTTREIASLSGGSLSVTSRVLKQTERKGLIRKVIRGLWCVPTDSRFTPFALVHHLSRGDRSYVSFLSALHLHGLIEQIPQVIYVATTGHSRSIRTTIGAFSFHRISPKLFSGFDWYGDQRAFLVATPEKALIDSLYLSSRKGKRFRFFPEIELPQHFSTVRAMKWVELIPDPIIRKYVLGRLRKITSHAREMRKVSSSLK